MLTSHCCSADHADLRTAPRFIKYNLQHLCFSITRIQDDECFVALLAMWSLDAGDALLEQYSHRSGTAEANYADAGGAFKDVAIRLLRTHFDSCLVSVTTCTMQP